MSLTTQGLRLDFRDPAGRDIRVLDIAEFTAQDGRLTVITGPSGSGKSTLLHVLSGLLLPDAGQVRWRGAQITALGEGARDRWRRRNVGMVFQNFHLIDELSPLDNVLAPGWFDRFSVGGLRARAAALLQDFDVPQARGRLAHLSRGEQQRVALARALLFDPPLILADEPTASLDRVAGATVIDRLRTLADAGRTVLAVSHEPDLIAAAGIVLRLERGRLSPQAVAA
ncbi:MAG: ATP-binding cassette domain-containing protein [Pseudomonadota bacterium]